MKGQSPLNSRNCAYLQHLDGLRALALLGVLAFHFEVFGASGGFVGVDVFLVLSGYLMTRNITLRIEAGEFSLKEFYVSRFWRLYPSLLITVFVTLVVSFHVFPPDLATRLAESSVAALLALSNMYFYSKANYFDVDSIRKPLLHTWSLSLEEQFYAIWPTVIVLDARLNPLSKNKTSLKAILTVLCCTSIGLAAYAQRTFPEMAFFSLPTRFYQFGLGGLAFLTGNSISQSSMLLANQNLLATFGCIAIGASYVTLPSQAPVLASTPAVLGAVSIVLAPNAWISLNILSSWPIRALGRMAYTAYLVHWPLVVFLRFLSGGLHIEEISHPIFLLIATIILSSALQNGVEIPWRYPPRRTLRLLLLLLTTSGLVASCFYTAGWAFRGHRDDEVLHRRRLRESCEDVRGELTNLMQTSGCLVTGRENQLTNQQKAEFSRGSLPPVQALVVGNSYAHHLLAAFDKLAREGGNESHPFMFSFRGGCPLRLKLAPGRPINDRAGNKIPDECRQQDRDTWELIEAAMPGSTVIVANDWAHADSLEEAYELAEEIIRIGNHRVLIAAAAPSHSRDNLGVFSCYDLITYSTIPWSALLPSSRACAQYHEPTPSRASAHDALLKGYTEPQKNNFRRSNFTYVNFWAEMCQTESGKDAKILCDNWIERGHQQHPYFKRDGAHFSFRGSESLAPILRRAIDTVAT